MKDEIAEEIAAEIGKRVRVLRHQKNWSLKKMASDLGMSHQYLNRIEWGYSGTSLYMLYRIAKLCEVPLSYFFDDFPL